MILYILFLKQAICHRFRIQNDIFHIPLPKQINSLGTVSERFRDDFAWPGPQIDGFLMISLGQGCKSAVLGPNLGIWRPENEEIVVISLKIQLFGISSCCFFHENSIHLNKKCWPAQHLRAKSTKNILQTLRFESQKPPFP